MLKDWLKGYQLFIEMHKKTQQNKMIQLGLLAIFILSFTVCKSSEPINFHYLPDLDERVYSTPGDINIGAMVFVLEDSLSHPAEKCSEKVISGIFEFENTESIAFAVDLVNRNPNILPNISLGFVIRGICSSIGVALGTSLSFLSQSERICNGSMCSIQEARSLDSQWLSHDVIGMVGLGWSTYTLPMSSLLSVAHLPIVGPTETSDDFSNKRNHPYFFRVVPPDMYQVQAILKFIADNGWSYISVLYEDGPNGLKNYDTLRLNVDRYGICIATSHRLVHPPKYDEIVSDLLAYQRARVVVLFTLPELFRGILQAVVDKDATRHFVWVGSDMLINYLGYEYKGIDYDPAIGTFTFDIYAVHMQEFFEYMRGQRVSTSSNPWIRPVWDYLFDCSLEDGTCNPDISVLDSKKYKTYIDTPFRTDAVLALAHATHNLLSSRCPHARGKEARDCVTGELLREYLKNVSFDGFNGHVEFDENQDLKSGRYRISQLVFDHFRHPFESKTKISGNKTILRKYIGVYEISTDTFIYSNESVSWSHISSDYRESLTGDRDTYKVPQSVCSTPCRMGEYTIEKEVPCCWECRKCRDNERVVKDNTTCESCPSFMWPDEASGFTTCIDIPLSYPGFKDLIPIVFTILAILALTVTVFVFVNYMIYRNEKVIKASSKELSVIQLFAIFIGYTTVILFQIKPSDMLCSIIFFLFCMSFALLYCPLLVKTIRICRIFKSGSKNQKPRFISPLSQTIFALCLIVVQGSICITIYILYSPRARRTQPIWSEKMVELSCDLTFPGILSFLGYNIVLVCLCSVFAFMVRSLPDNFNESKFISMCVTTTLLVFLAFIPAYFTADREFVRGFLLSVALFLNHSVALIFLFIPKIYAAKFLPSEEGDFSKNRS